MMKKAISLLSSLLVSTMFAGAQQGVTPATFTIAQPKSSFQIGDRIRLELTIKNVSQKDIVFRGGVPRGEYMLEWVRRER